MKIRKHFKLKDLYVKEPGISETCIKRNTGHNGNLSLAEKLYSREVMGDLEHFKLKDLYEKEPA